MSRGPEDTIQSATVSYIEAVAPQCVVFAVPNAAKRAKGARASNAIAGLKRGVPDLTILHGDGRCAFIEIKAPGKGCSDDQRDVLLTLLELKIPFAVAYSLEDAKLALAMFGISTREAI